MELEQRVNTYDSIQHAFAEMQSLLSSLRDEVQQKVKLVKDMQHIEGACYTLRFKNRSLLFEIGGNPDSILPPKQSGKLKSPTIDLKYKFKSEMMKSTFQLMSVESISDFSDLKIKVQNIVLDAKLKEYDSINKLNSIILLDEKKNVSALTDVRNEYTRVAELYTAFNEQLKEEVDALATEWYVVSKRKQIEREVAHQKALKELEVKSKRQKSGTIQFIPLVISNIDYEPEYLEEKPVFIGQKNPYDLIERTKESDVEFAPIEKPEMKYPEPPKEPVIIEIVDEIAEFPGGHAVLMKYLKDNLVLPDYVVSGEISGKVYVRFVISSSGNISNVNVTRGIADCKECDMEAMRVVKGMPNWKPGKNNGKPVNQWYVLPIKFAAD